MNQSADARGVHSDVQRGFRPVGSNAQPRRSRWFCGTPSPFLGVLERLLVQVLVLTVLGAAATRCSCRWFSAFSMTRIPRLMSFGSASRSVGPFLAALVLRRTALHQFYRNSLHAGFERSGTSAGTAQVPSVARPYLELVADGAPSTRRSCNSQCETQGPERPSSDVRLIRVLSRSSGIPSSAMIFSTPKLETARSDAYLGVGTEPLLTLPTAVAATGAAISASMGDTRPRSASSSPS